MREPETIADVVEDLSESYGLNPDQKISTLIKAAEDDELGEDLEENELEETDEYNSGYADGYKDGSEDSEDEFDDD